MPDQPEWVTLISSDGHRFVLPRSAALGSDFLLNTLSADFLESSTGVVRLPEMRAEVLEKVAEYLLYKDRWKETKGEIPDFRERVKPEIALELLMASDYLEC
ncbi:elongin C [Rhodotorula kratochvilovae]